MNHANRLSGTAAADGPRRVERPHLAIVASHPIQYQAPLFRALADRLDLTVYFAHRSSAQDQARAGFGVDFAWDSDLFSGYDHIFLNNVSAQPRTDRFSGCDTPDLYSHLAQGRFDAVLVSGWHLKSYVQAISYAKRLRLPVMARGDSHLSTPRSPIKRVVKAAAYPLLLRSFDAALYVGRRSREYWKHYGYPDKRLTFSPHCVDNDWFRARATPDAGRALRTRLGIGEDEQVLLFAGKLLDFKRPLDLVNAAAMLRSRGLKVRVLIAGSGPLAAKVEATAAGLKVPLSDLGFCNQSEMPPAYAACEVMVLPSTRETWGLVANEALACGKPILLSDAVGSAPDLAADGMAGATFAIGNVESLAAAAERLLRSPPEDAAIREKSDRYSLAAAADGVLTAIEHVARARDD